MTTTFKERQEWNLICIVHSSPKETQGGAKPLNSVPKRENERLTGRSHVFLAIHAHLYWKLLCAHACTMDSEIYYVFNRKYLGIHVM